MKILLFILLLITTVAYVIPVKNILAERSCISMIDIDEEKDTDSKKEKYKEIFYLANNIINADLKYKSTHHFTTLTTPLLLHKVETPPPNAI